MIEVPKLVPSNERETVIQWDMEEQVVNIWTCQPPVIRKLFRKGVFPTTESRSASGELHGYTYKIPLEKFRWNLKGTKKKRANDSV